MACSMRPIPSLTERLPPTMTARRQMVLPSSAWTLESSGRSLGDALVKLAGTLEQLDPHGVHGRDEQELVLAHLGVEAFDGIECEPEVGLGPLLRFPGQRPVRRSCDRAFVS